MDNRQFDALARAFADAKSRRHVLKVLCGGIAGGIGAILTRSNAARAGECLADGQPCSTGAECCGGGCNDFCFSICADLDEPCAIDVRIGGTRALTAPLNCCEGLTCDPDSGTCVVPCAEIGELCESDDDCCEGTVCNGAGECAEACASERDTCENISDCCLGSFCQDTANGLACVPSDSCLLTGDPCQEVGEVTAAAAVIVCCEGLTCIDGVCGVESPICGELGDACDDNEDCCEGLTCFEALCDNPKGCFDAGEDCGSDEDCCEGLICSDGTCGEAPTEDTGEDVSELPDTGAGDSSGDGNLAGAALIAGAAALMAARTLRQGAQTSETDR